MTDRRTTPVNDRVVAARLAADHPDRTPVRPEACFVALPVADILRAPDGPRERQLPYGWRFEVLERRAGFAFGEAPEAAYVGWVREEALRPEAARGAPGVWVQARQSHAYTAPDLKSPEVMALPHLARLAPGRREGRFVETEAGWVPVQHLAETPAKDPVAVAELYLGVPYLWGGNSPFGIDCSGLVKNACAACGLPCPGDSDLQAALGVELAPDAPLARGDLVFWKGHVAMVLDGARLIHANAGAMAVSIEGIDAALARIAAQGDGPVTHRRRLAG